jgi:hypothetical protein
MAPAPILKVSYGVGNLNLYASFLDGLGIQYLDMERRVLVGGAVNFGRNRDDEGYRAVLFPRDYGRRIAEHLAGSPAASSLLRAESMLGWVSPVGILGVSLKYFPTTVEEAGGDDFYHAFLPSAFLLLPLPLTEKLAVTGMATLQFMDKNFAAAWYSVKESTAGLEEFDAEAGLESVRFTVQTDYMFTERIGASIFAESAFLLNDAAESPYTRSRYQFVSGLYAFYKF